MLKFPIALLAAVFCVACSTEAAQTPDRDVVASSTLATPTTALVSPTTEQQARALTESAPTEQSPTVDADAPDPNAPPSDCLLLTDFVDAEGQRRWTSVNDDVMGGRSAGAFSFMDDRLIFEGATNTNGGGFASVRLPIEIGQLADTTAIVLRATVDDRSYMLTLDDDAEGRDRRLTHRSPIRLDASETSEPARSGTATLPLADFSPAIFGEPVDAAPVEPAFVDELGLMINDGVDGPFRLEVFWIAACP